MKPPPELVGRDQWVLWREEFRNPTDKKKTKVPYQSRGSYAKSNDPETWSDFEKVYQLSLLGDWDGVGFMFHEDDPFCGIDLDGCRDPETGKVSEWARAIVIDFASYAEVSPSQTGIKIFIRGKSPFATGKKVELDEPAVCEKTPGIEVYDHKRYFAVTGKRLTGMPRETRECQPTLNRWCSEWFPSRSAPKASSDATGVSERAARYVSKMPPAVSGQSGHNTTFRVACVLTKGFGLSVENAYPILAEWNQACDPPWSEKEMRHKLDSAAKTPGDENYLRDVPLHQQESITVPDYEPPQQTSTLKDAAEQYLDKVRKGEDSLVSLGVANLDESIGGGVAMGELIVVGARPGHGKSAIGLQITHAATRQNLPCLIISEEMTALAMGKRAIQFASNINEKDWREQLENVSLDLGKHFHGVAPCYVSESVGTAERADALIRHSVARDGVKLVVIDYAQLLQGKGNSRYEQVTNTSITLRHLATDLGIIVIVLCQMNREIEKREKWFPRMGDLKDSGQLEQDADVLTFLLYPHKLDPSRDIHEYVVFVAKNRSRETRENMIECRFEPARQMVVESEYTDTKAEGNRYWDKDDDGF